MCKNNDRMELRAYMPNELKNLRKSRFFFDNIEGNSKNYPKACIIKSAGLKTRNKGDRT